MKASEIRFNIELDDNNIPDKIFWNATDNPSGKLEEAKAIAVSVWDHHRKETLRIDLWTKDMPVDDMKLLCIDTIGGMAETIKSATGDELMYAQMIELCKKLADHVQAESGNA